MSGSNVEAPYPYSTMEATVREHEGYIRRKIRLIESNAKCRYPKKNLPVKGLCTSARIYRPAFSWKQAQNARIQSLKPSVMVMGLFSRQLGL